jgi:hypothetical protein
MTRFDEKIGYLCTQILTNERKQKDFIIITFYVRSSMFEHIDTQCFHQIVSFTIRKLSPGKKSDNKLGIE